MPLERHKLNLGPAQLIYTKVIGSDADTYVADALHEYQQLLAAARARGQKLVEVLDIRESATPTPKQRRMQADWNHTHEQLLRETLLGFTFVVSSVVMRGMITAVFWLKPLPVPHSVHTDLDTATTWAFNRFREVGLTISDSTRENARRALTSRPGPAKAAGS